MSDPHGERQCGDCTLCCKILAVTELNKPKGTWCSHVVKKTGCGIYESRPQSCRAFKCLWLTDDNLPADWRPNKAKFVMVGESKTGIVVHVDANFPGAWRNEPYISGLRAMAEKGQSLGQLLVIVERGASTVLFPDREMPVGVLADDDRLVSGHVATPQGPRFEVKVMKEEEAARHAAQALNWRQPKTR